MKAEDVRASYMRPYDPQYDPLVDANPGRGTGYAPTYWVGTAGRPPEDDGPVCGDMEADVVIVGSGFTGLSTALFLAREHGIRAVVLEANQSAWGCTSRNGGQGQNASGRLYRSQWIERWGKDVALKLDAEIREGFGHNLNYIGVDFFLKVGLRHLFCQVLFYCAIAVLLIIGRFFQLVRQIF